MDPDLRRRRQEQDGRDAALEEEGPVAHPFWSERARAEVDLMRARPADLDSKGDKLPEVRVDEEEIHPAYGGEGSTGGGKGQGSPSGTLDGVSRGRTAAGEKPRDLPRIQEVETTVVEDGHPKTAPEPTDLLSMSPVKPEAFSENNSESPKPSLERPGVGLTGQPRELSAAKLVGVQNLSGSGALDSEVGGSSRAFRRPTLETSEDVGAQEVSSTTVESVSDGKVLNMSHSFSGESSGSVGVRVGRAEGASEGTAKRSILLSPEAQGSLKGLAYEISDPSDQQFEIARLRSLVEHLHDRLERAETERSTRRSRSFGSASSGRRVEDVELKGQRVNLQGSEGYPLPPVPPLPPFASEGWHSWAVSDPLQSSPDQMDFFRAPQSPVPPMDFDPSSISLSGPGAAISPSEIPAVDFGLQSSMGPPYAPHASGPTMLQGLRMPL